jgi:uroporphyrinogen-III decarboxylase
MSPLNTTIPFDDNKVQEWIQFQEKQQARKIGVSKEELDDLISNLDLEDYADRFEPIIRRLDACARFEHPDRVPLSFSVSGSFFCKLNDGKYRMNANLRDYYTNFELDIEVQARGLRWAHEELRDDRLGGGFHAEFGPIGEGVLFGFKIIYPDDTSPWIVRELETKEDVERFIRTEFPHPEDHPGLKYVRELSDRIKDRVESAGGRLGAGAGMGIHPPLSASCSLMEPVRVIKLMYTDPDLVHRFFSKLAEERVKLHEYEEEQSGRRIENFGHADDHMLMLTPDQYRRFEMPHIMAMNKRFGRESRRLHGDGPNDHLFEILVNEVKLTDMDIGGFSSLEKAAEILQGKVRFSGGLNSKDFYIGTPFEKVKAKIDHCLEVAGNIGGYRIAIGGETYVHVDPALLRRTVEYVDHAARLPLQ